MNRRLRAAAALAIFLLPFGCATRDPAGPPLLDLSLSHASDAGKFLVAIRPLVDPAPRVVRDTREGCSRACDRVRRMPQWAP